MYRYGSRDIAWASGRASRSGIAIQLSNYYLPTVKSLQEVVGFVKPHMKDQPPSDSTIPAIESLVSMWTEIRKEVGNALRE